MQLLRSTSICAVLCVMQGTTTATQHDSLDDSFDLALHMLANSSVSTKDVIVQGGGGALLIKAVYDWSELRSKAAEIQGLTTVSAEWQGQFAAARNELNGKLASQTRAARRAVQEANTKLKQFRTAFRFSKKDLPALDQNLEQLSGKEALDALDEGKRQVDDRIIALTKSVEAQSTFNAVAGAWALSASLKEAWNAWVEYDKLVDPATEESFIAKSAWWKERASKLQGWLESKAKAGAIEKNQLFKASRQAQKLLREIEKVLASVDRSHTTEQNRRTVAVMSMATNALQTVSTGFQWWSLGTSGLAVPILQKASCAFFGAATAANVFTGVASHSAIAKVRQHLEAAIAARDGVEAILASLDSDDDEFDTDA